MAGSHKKHKEIFAARAWQLRQQPDNDFWTLNEKEQRELLAQPGCVLVHVATAPGDMVLFSSRTIHCGRRARAAGAPWRFALYICMAPARSLSDADRRRKAARVMGLAWRGGAWRPEGQAETSTHPPNGANVVPRAGWGRAPVPPHVREGITQAPAFARTPDALRLAGVLPYNGDGGGGAWQARGAGIRLGTAGRDSPPPAARRVAEPSGDGMRTPKRAKTASPSAAAAAEVIVIDDDGDDATTPTPPPLARAGRAQPTAWPVIILDD